MPGRTRGWWLRQPRGNHVKGMLGGSKTPRRPLSAEQVLARKYNPPDLTELPPPDL